MYQNVGRMQTAQRMTSTKIVTAGPKNVIIRKHLPRLRGYIPCSNVNPR
jgi:hypothetical protein